MGRCLKFGCVLVVNFLLRNNFEIFEGLKFLLEIKNYARKTKKKMKEFYRCQRRIHKPVKYLRWNSFLNAASYLLDYGFSKCVSMQSYNLLCRATAVDR